MPTTQQAQTKKIITALFQFLGMSVTPNQLDQAVQAVTEIISTAQPITPPDTQPPGGPAPGELALDKIFTEEEKVILIWAALQGLHLPVGMQAVCGALLVDEITLVRLRIKVEGVIPYSLSVDDGR